MSCLEKNRFIMEKIIRMNGYVYLVQDWDKKGFETYVNLGKDPDYWENLEKEKTQKKKSKKDEV